MRKLVSWVGMLVIQFFSALAHAYDLNHSGRTEIWDNPFIAFGYNPKTKVTTGYLAALRIAPGRTDECKLVFAGSANRKDDFSVRFLGENLSSNSARQVNRKISVLTEGDMSYLKFPKKNLGADCDWILPFVVETDLSENSNEVVVEMNVQNAGDWISVYVIGAQKASFYSRPDSSSARKAYLVKGDVVYVYKEQSEWYYVRYGEGKTNTEGWIRKSDTLQP